MNKRFRSTWSTTLRIAVVLVIASHAYFSWNSDQFYPGLFLPKFKSRHMGDSIEVTSVRFVAYRQQRSDTVSWKQMLRPFDKRYFRYIIENSRTDHGMRNSVRMRLESVIGSADSVHICIGTSHFDRHGKIFHHSSVACERF